MVHLPRPMKRRGADATIALINIVFLMLVFFLVAGTIVPPQEGNIIPPLSAIAERGDAPNDAVFITHTGDLVFRNRIASLTDVVEGLGRRDETDRSSPVKIVADRRLDARRLIDVLDALKGGGFTNLRVITTRGR